MQSETREHYWDFARAAYLLLGIPFHAAVSYSTHFEWSVASPDRSVFLTVVADILHTFRMPGFFLIAGYFSFMLLMRRGWMAFLKTRITRLGVPLVTATVIILPLQMAIQTYAEVLNGTIASSAFGAVLVARLTHFDEHWISHLWFLYVLIGLTFAIALCVWILRAEWFAVFYRRTAEFAYRYRYLSFVVVVTLCAGLATILPLAERLGGSKLMALLSDLQYSPYFFLGGAVYLSPLIKKRYLNFGLLGLAGGLLLAFCSILPAETGWQRTVFMVSGFFAALMLTGFVAHLAHRYFNRANATVRNIADASFTIYLFHHPIIFVLATVFARIELPPVLEFAIITPATGVVAYGLHRMITAHAVSAFLFNGSVSDAPRSSASKDRKGRRVAAGSN